MKISLDDVSITTLSLLSEEENSEKAEQDSSSGIIRAQVLLIASLIVDGFSCYLGTILLLISSRVIRYTALRKLALALSMSFLHGYQDQPVFFSGSFLLTARKIVTSKLQGFMIFCLSV
jgi:hypothetical protein